MSHRPIACAPVNSLPSLTDGIRQDCRRVAESSRSVHIETQHIPAYAASFDSRHLRLPTLDPSCHYLGQGDATAAFMLTLEAVNFGSADLASLRQDEPLSGYFSIARALNRHFQRHGPLRAIELAELELDQCIAIFDQEGQPPAKPLMRRFTSALNDLGQHLLEHFDGSFALLLDSAEGSAQRLVEVMSGMDSFRDEAIYDGEVVRFYKRAQLAAADLSLAFEGQGLGRLGGLRHLTIFADDLVPHVLRMDGILRYSQALADRVDEGIYLEAGSAEEVEIRAGAIHAAELIVAELRGLGRSACAMQVDYCLWNRGLRPTYQQKPRHRTVTDFY